MGIDTLSNTAVVSLLERECSFIRVGDIIDERYRVVGFIGAGGVSCVYLAEHLYTGRRVALKVLKPRVREIYPSAEKHFREEARRIPEDPNVVEVYDAGVDSERNIVYIAMEYCPKSLRKLLEEGASREELLRILLDVARAVARLHEKGIVHLDLKPENILVDENGVVKICDFGFARFKAETCSRSSGIWGTPVYTAPEVWSGEYSEKSDVYSLGVILAEILTGEPYSRDIFDPELADLVRWSTDMDPSMRITAEKFVDTLSRYLSRLAEERRRAEAAREAFKPARVVKKSETSMVGLGLRILAGGILGAIIPLIGVFCGGLWVSFYTEGNLGKKLTAAALVGVVAGLIHAITIPQTLFSAEFYVKIIIASSIFFMDIALGVIGGLLGSLGK